LLYIKPCPVADAGPERALCALSPTPQQIGTFKPGYVYNWSPATGLSSSTVAQPMAKPSETTTYTVTVTGPNGCTSTDEVTVRVDKTKPSFSIGASIEYLCGGARTLTPLVVEPGSYLWSTGATTPSIEVNPSVPITYTLTMSNACGSASNSFRVAPYVPPTDHFPELIAPNVFTPNGDDYNDYFNIYEYAPANPSYAYNATRWSFDVFDRWGVVIAHKEGKAAIFGPWANSLPGIINGSIPMWDGTSLQGNLLPQGVYTYMFSLGNCSYHDLQVVKVGSVTLLR
jgi:hypothetical protein